MTPSPLISNIHARRPWLQQLLEPDVYGFSARAADAPRPVPEIAERLIAAYQHAQHSCPEDFQPNDVWRDFVARHYGDMLTLIQRGDTAGLMDYLIALPARGAGHGYFQGLPAYQALRSDPEKQRERALWLLDHLAGLAEALGVLPLRCPEQGEWQEPAFSSVPALCAEIETALGCSVSLPPVFDGFFALHAEAGPCHLRSLMPAYALHQLQRFFLHAHGRSADTLKIAEIGAGIGCTAYLAGQLGLARHGVFDLPEVNLAQGFFLMTTLGADQVRLYGEPAGPPIEVMPPWAFGPAMDQGYDAVLNIDSFPEIDRSHARAYLQSMRTGADYFFSINQEAPRPDPRGGRRESVRTMATDQPGFQPLLRHPNWIRAGYVDELFGIAPSGAGA